MSQTLTSESNIQNYSVPRLAAITDESEAVWRKRILQKKIQYIKCGRNVRVPRIELERWLASRTVACCKDGPK
jgi:hypothetical protein